MRVRGLALFALCLTAALSAAGQPAPDRVTAALLLDRASWYLGYFIDQFENVVAEEDYIQDASVLLPSYIPGGRGARLAPSLMDMPGVRHRDLRSDFLLVKSPDTEDALLPFRDVLMVDGVAVRDHEQRLSRLFVEASGDMMTRATRVLEEGARYNLGNMRSTLGNPVLGLSVLQASYQRRFHFTLGKEDKHVGPGVWVLEYGEDASPSMIHGEAGSDLFSHGRAWIEAASGRVYKTEVRVEQPTVRAVVTTSFRFDDRFGIAVPHEMREQYTLSNGNKVTMVATYGRFRRFDVSSDEDVHLPRRTIADGLTGMTMVEVLPGRFTMGSASSEAGRQDDEVIHDVEITHPFLLGRHEVTQQEWRAVMGTSPSQFKTCGPKCPVENVSFLDIQQYLDKLNAKTGSSVDALRYRLPTEAEWEYACRAGTTGPFSTGENLTTQEANYNGRQPYASFPPGEFRQHPMPVGTFGLNPWGFADMHGNVWEWTADWYGPFGETSAANIDPHGSASGEKRVIRGGSWTVDANSARCALRDTHAPQDRTFSVGFRLAADPRP
jgi:formylglycine-generating enzyme required for sulfatase activity